MRGATRCRRTARQARQTGRPPTPALADEPAQHEQGYAAENLRLRVDSQHRALDLPAGAIELRRKAFDDRRDGTVHAVSATSSVSSRTLACCFPLYLVRSPSDLTGLFGRRIS